ncbi:hypothetical protein C8R44DRAFT_886093 [Mycena epipterygia]|nr:hypothetical protein C8R44DRAFT_886093 [Mycena epipterygia]
MKFSSPISISLLSAAISAEFLSTTFPPAHFDVVIDPASGMAGGKGTESRDTVSKRNSQRRPPMHHRLLDYCVGISCPFSAGLVKFACDLDSLAPSFCYDDHDCDSLTIHTGFEGGAHPFNGGMPSFNSHCALQA